MTEHSETTGCVGCLFVLAVLDGVVLGALSWAGITLPSWFWWVDYGVFAVLGLTALLITVLADRNK